MEGNIYENNSGQRRRHCHLYFFVTICVVLQIAGLCAWICMYSQINAGIQDLDAKVSALKAKDSQINAGIQDLDDKVSALNVKDSQINAGIEDLDAKVLALNMKDSQINAGIQDLDAKVSALKAKDSQINAGIQDLDDKVSALNVKVLMEISGWKRFGRKVYYLSKTTITWEMARVQCITMGATLAMVKTEEELKFLANAIAQPYWVGLSDLGTEGNWKWLDGTSPASGMWTPGEPNNAGEEDCGEVVKKLNDVSCGQQRHWICEKSSVI